MFLPREGIERLFALVRDAAAAGAAILFVSHDLDEVREITDRVTVLRDGALVGTVVTNETSETAFVEMIIGRRLAALAELEHADLHRAARSASPSSDLTGGSVRDVSFDLHEGEIVGLTGLIGSGFEEVPLPALRRAPGAGRAARRPRRGDRPHAAHAAPRAIACRNRADPGRPPERRQRRLAAGRREPGPGRARPLLQRRRARAAADAARDRGADARVRRPARTTRRCPTARSRGGNQQKALLAKWFQTEPRLLLLDEPTQGVDVGARQQIFELIRAAVAGARHARALRELRLRAARARSATACSSSAAAASGASSSATR